MNIDKSTLCALCGINPPIHNSHQIPSFVSRWIIENSATGRIRQTSQPNLPKQDVDTFALLCPDCEIRFSRFEKKFAETIFLPFLDEDQTDFQYEEWLLQFAISIAWRTSVIHLDESQLDSDSTKITYAAMDCWKSYLLGKTSDAGQYAHHLLFLKALHEGSDIIPPREFHRYLSRAIDSSIVTGENSIFIYTKLPNMIFWSTIEPYAIDGWHKTQIFKKGQFDHPQHVEQPGWGDFLFNRCEQVMDSFSQISDRQSEKIQTKVQANQFRSLNSKTFEIAQLDDYWDKRRAHE